MSDDITPLTVRQLLGEEAYLIPMYQRNYAWEEAEIAQLIEDIADYVPRPGRYYIGTLVVFERRSDGLSRFETIDGQQRLTTLALLAIYLREQRPWLTQINIHFECRAHSRRTLQSLFRDGHRNPSPSARYNDAILSGYRIIEKVLRPKLRERDISVEDFARYLFERVQIMRVQVPHDTDLNHYFEIMNNRGEQLEKHEVLKARMLQVLEEGGEPAESLACLHRVWEACANMEVYVQMGFSVAQRDALFGRDWTSLQPTDFDALRAALGAKDRKARDGAPQRLSDLIEGRHEHTATEDDSPERFTSVISFPNFLLQVLRVMRGTDVPLDDKRLLDIFKAEVFVKDPAMALERVKAFVYALLRCKIRFDRYVIKREFVGGLDRWSLKQLEENRRKNQYVNTFSDKAANRKLLMLLSALHVSTPTQIYKHWLSAALRYLWTHNDIDADAYLAHMEDVARAFLADRFLAKKKHRLEYYDIIFRGTRRARRQGLSKKLMRARTRFGETENNLIFNYLDYLLWKQSGNRVDSFELTFRSSVEHYYPQNPFSGASLPEDVLHSFGNLCLISHSKNSRLSNRLPAEKKEYHEKSGTIDSLKQQRMMAAAVWDAAAICAHEDEMIALLHDDLMRG